MTPERAEQLRAKLRIAHDQLRLDRERYDHLAAALQLPTATIDDTLHAARRMLMAGEFGEAADAAQHELRRCVFEALAELLVDPAAADLVVSLYAVLDAHLLRDL